MTDDPKWQELGMVPGIPGHHLQEEDPRPGSSNDRFYLICSCGCQIYGGQVTKAGKLGSRPRRQWREHLEGVSAPEELIPIGRVHKKRVITEVVVMSSNYSKLSTYKMRGKGPWATKFTTDWYRTRGVWVAGLSKSTGENSILSSYSTRADAIDGATKWIRNQQGEASALKVEYASDGAHFDAPSFSPTSSIAMLLDEIDACMDSEDLALYAETSAHLEDALRLMPILQAKHKIFLNRRAKLFGL